MRKITPGGQVPRLDGERITAVGRHNHQSPGIRGDVVAVEFHKGRGRSNRHVQSGDTHRQGGVMLTRAGLKNSWSNAAIRTRR